MSDEHRIRGHIPWSSVDARLRALRELWVTTASPDGKPDAVPVWFWWDGERVYFTSGPRGWKARNLLHQPAVVLHNGDGADTIILKGDAEVVTDREELARIDAAYGAKYVDPYSGTQAELVEGDVAFRVRPRLVLAWSYAAMSTRTDWRFA
jgi:PPOX class probable F420-dependent enzyme